MPPDPIEQQVRKMLERQGRFDVLKVLGKGAMGSVVLARDKKLGVRRAIKVINPQFMKSRIIRTRFMAEARVMARLERGSIVRVYDVGEFKGWMYIVMEYLDGGTLGDHLREFGPMPARQAVEVVLSILDALEAAHTFVDEDTSEHKPVVHRDVKPENVLFTRRGIAKLADFGIAHIDEHTMDLTAADSMMGTLGYMAPEQKVDAASADHRADIHAVAVLLWMMLNWESGKHEHPGPNDFFLTISMPSRMSKVPDELQNLIMTATAEKPESRYQSVDVMATELRSALRDLPEPPEDTPALGSVREVRLSRVAKAASSSSSSSGMQPLSSNAVAAAGEGDDRPGTLVPMLSRGQPNGHASSTGEGLQSPVSQVPVMVTEPPKRSASDTWGGIDLGEDRGGTILPSDDLDEDEAPMSEAALRKLEDQLRERNRRRLVVVACVLVTVFVVFAAAVALWIWHDPAPTRSLEDFATQEQEVVTLEVTEPAVDEPLVDLPVDPVDPVEDAVALVEPPTPEAITPEPREVVREETTPRVQEVITPDPPVEPVVEAAKVKLILKSADDGMVLHLSGDGGTFHLSAQNPIATVPHGTYRAMADFDRDGASPGMSVGTLTVDPGLVTVTCRSQMSLCTGSNLRR